MIGPWYKMMSVLAGPCWETGCWPQLRPQNRFEIVEFVVLVRLVLYPGAKEKAMQEFLQMQIKQASASHELIFSRERGQSFWFLGRIFGVPWILTRCRFSRRSASPTWLMRSPNGSMKAGSVLNDLQALQSSGSTIIYPLFVFGEIWDNGFPLRCSPWQVRECRGLSCVQCMEHTKERPGFILEQNRKRSSFGHANDIQWSSHC